MDGHDMERWEEVESISWDEIRSIVWSRFGRFACSVDEALLLFVEICKGLPHKMNKVRMLNLSQPPSSISVRDKLSYRALSALVQIVKAGYFSKLQKLDISGWRIRELGRVYYDRAFVEILGNAFQSGHWQQLQQLRLSDVPLFGRVVQTLANYAASGYLNNLVSLDLSHNTFGHKGATALIKSFALGQFSKLTSLNLSWNKLGDAKATELAESLTSGGLTNLQKLNLRGCDIGNAGIIAFAKSFASDKCPKLTSLDFSDNDLGEAGVEYLCQSFKSSQLNDLQALSLSHIQFYGRGVVALAKQFKDGNLRKLEELDLSHGSFAVEGCEWLCEAIALGHLSNIKTLDLSSNILEDDAIASLVNSFCHGCVSNMESLHLSRTGMGREGASSLARWLQTSDARKLQALNLSENYMGDIAVADLASSLQSSNLSKLKHLNLSANNIGRAGAEALALSFKGAQLSELTTLNLSHNGMVDKVPTERVSQSSHSVESLSQHDHDFNQDGVTALMRSFQSDCWKKLQTLDLSVTGINDVGVEVLAEAITQGFMSALQHLHLFDIRAGQNAMLLLFQTYGRGEWQGFDVCKSDPDVYLKTNWTQLTLSRIMALPRPVEYIPGELTTSRTLWIHAHLAQSIANRFLTSIICHLGQLQVLRISGFAPQTTMALFEPTQSGQWKRLHALIIHLESNRLSHQSEKIKAFLFPNVSSLEYIQFNDELMSDERDVIIKEMVQALEAGNLQNLQELQLFHYASEFNAVSEDVRQTLVNCYRRNPYLVARICSEDLEIQPGLMRDIDALRRANEERVTRLRELGVDPDVPGKHGKVFLCGDGGVGKTTLRRSLAKEAIANSAANSTTNSAANSIATSIANSTANSEGANSTANSEGANSAASSTANSAANSTANAEGGKKGRWFNLRWCQQGCMTWRRQSPTSKTKSSPTGPPYRAAGGKL